MFPSSRTLSFQLKRNDFHDLLTSQTTKQNCRHTTNTNNKLTSLGIVVFFFHRDGNEALGNEFGLFFPGLAGQGLFDELSSADTLATARLELSHVFAVALTLFLLGVGSATQQSEIQLGGRGNGKGLRVK